MEAADEAAHQFVSLATSASGWLNEGLASFFEGCRILPNGTVLMNMPANHRLFPLVERIGKNNAKGEFYLTDIVGLARADGARAYANIALTYATAVNFQWTGDREEAIRLGLEFADRALEPGIALDEFEIGAGRDDEPPRHRKIGLGQSRQARALASGFTEQNRFDCGKIKQRFHGQPPTDR